MIKVHVDDSAVMSWIKRLINRLSSGKFWNKELGDLAKDARRYAADISPVATGSYRDAHEVAIGDRKATLTIDPTARNIKSGGLVSRYAADVEAKHQVYGRTGAYVARIGAQRVEIMGERLLGHE